jgi:hypothetical protein
MNTAIIKTSKAAKILNSAVLNHLDSVERAREIYLAQIKRAEADYFDRIKRATSIMTGEESTVIVTEPPAPTPVLAPAPSPDAP